MSCVPPENMPPYEEGDEEEEEDHLPTIGQEIGSWDMNALHPSIQFPPPAQRTVELYSGALIGIDTTTRTLAITFKPKGDLPAPAVLYKEKEAFLFLAQLRSTLIYLSQMPVSPPIVGGD